MSNRLSRWHRYFLDGCATIWIDKENLEKSDSAGSQQLFGGGVMGWWRIDPTTGEPASDSRSKLSQPPDFALLNAVPGIDDEKEAHYLGDGPWDMVFSAVSSIGKVLGAKQQFTEEEARGLFFKRIIPASLAVLPPKLARELVQIVDEMWKDVDGCYEDDWERPVRPLEKRWIGEYAVSRLTNSD